MSIKNLNHSRKKEVRVSDKKKRSSNRRLIIEAEEMHTYVSNQSIVPWLWLALDAKTREMIGVHLGTRDAPSAQTLFKSLPAVYRQCAICYTDQLASYSVVFPKTRHRSANKGLGKTNHIEDLTIFFDKDSHERLVRHFPIPSV